MRAESVVFAVAGMCFGVILGWVIGSQQAGPRAAVSAPQSQATAGAQTAGTQAGGDQQTPPLDEARVKGLMTIVNSDPNNAGAYIQLGNAYFDAEQYTDAIKWYEQGLKLDPKNVDGSTDLGVSYYYSNRADDALKQFQYSLTLNPSHTKTLLNQGIVLAFGKNDLNAAADVWKQVVALAPNSPEAEAAKRGLEGIAAAQAKRTPNGQ